MQNYATHRIYDNVNNCTRDKKILKFIFLKYLSR